MDKKVSIYANWKYETFDRVLARIGNLDVWEPGFYSRTVTLPDGSVGYLLVGSREVFKEIVPYTELTAELVGTVALAPTFSAAEVEGWVSDREPWFVVGTPVLCSDFLPGEAGWDGGRFGIAQYVRKSQCHGVLIGFCAPVGAHGAESWGEVDMPEGKRVPKKSVGWKEQARIEACNICKHYRYLGV